MKNREVTRNWHLIDADGKVLGRISTEIATLLRGKDKVTFLPNLDEGDYVVVINASKIKITGAKLDQKKYYKHTGYLGNLKEVSMKDLMAKDPASVVTRSVAGMLPKNKLQDLFLKRLKVYAGSEHPHQNVKFITEE